MLQKLFYQTIGSKLNLIPPADLFSNPNPKDKNRHKRRPVPKRKNQSQPSEADQEAGKKMKSYVQQSCEANDAASAEKIDDTEQNNDDKISPKTTDQPEVDQPTNCEDVNSESQKLDETITLTQIHQKYKFVGESSDSESDSEEDLEEKHRRKEAKKLKREVLKKKDEEKQKRKKLFSSPLILVKSLKVFAPF